MYEFECYLFFNSLKNENTNTFIMQGNLSNKLTLNSFNLELFEET
jgi:hypothetical protein